MKELSLIIPAYNEEGRIGKTLENYVNFLKNSYGSSFEIIAITDGCIDKTPKIIEGFAKKFPCIRHIDFINRLGKGGAIIEGFKNAKGRYVGFLDADGSTSLESVKLLVNNLSEYDGAIASRWADGSVIGRQEPFSRQMASRAFNILVRFLFGFHFKDTQCGAKFFRKEAVKSVINEIGLTDWAFDVDLLYRLNEKNYKIKETPVTWHYEEESKLNLKRTSIKMFLSVVGLKVKTSKLSFLAKSPLIKWLYEMARKL
jgi:glycosyltransferase involved in cell wall biosynthesis